MSVINTIRRESKVPSCKPTDLISTTDGQTGGVIPELDSEFVTESNPDPLKTRFSPWHPCGPDKEAYIAGMKRNAHLSLLGVVCRLAPGDGNGEEAATQWEKIFGVPRSRDLIAFTNARIGFMRGEEGKPDGITSISIGVNSDRRRSEIYRVAEERGLLKNNAGITWIEMFGIRWYFSLTTNSGEGSGSKL